jgi:hypothetical protein
MRLFIIVVVAALLLVSGVTFAQDQLEYVIGILTGARDIECQQYAYCIYETPGSVERQQPARPYSSSNC